MIDGGEERADPGSAPVFGKAAEAARRKLYGKTQRIRIF